MNPCERDLARARKFIEDFPVLGQGRQPSSGPGRRRESRFQADWFLQGADMQQLMACRAYDAQQAATTQ